jgi:hypothetical protein
MKPYASLDFAAIGAGWRVLQRHMRYAGNSPRKLLWIARRAIEIVRGGHLSGVLQRHRLVENFYAEYPRWLERDERDAARRVLQYAREMAQWPARPMFSILLPGLLSRASRTRAGDRIRARDSSTSSGSFASSTMARRNARTSPGSRRWRSATRACILSLAAPTPASPRQPTMRWR